MSNPPLEMEFERDLEALEKTGATMPFKPSEAYRLLRILQYASKACRNGKPDLAADAERLGREIESRLCKTPAMREIGHRGWNVVTEPEEPHPEEPEPDLPAKPRRTKSRRKK